MPITTLPLNRLLHSTDHADFSGRASLSQISTAIAKSKKVVVISGAGISCSSGIPDFRSEDGLYALVKSRYPDAFFTGKDLFSSGLFNNPATVSIFYTFIAELYASCLAAQPTRTHHFIHKLETKGKLLRSYTQNVDGLERRMGLESGGRGQGLRKKGTRNVELHGDLGRVRCVLCMKDYEAKEEWVSMFRQGEAPDCPCCHERSQSRVERSARALPIGTLRPSIVLYDEPHPLGDDIGALQTFDLGRNPDVLLIMGTSLKVHGLKRVVKEFAKVVHGRKGGMVVFCNATPPSKEWEGIIDYHVQGETDVWVDRVEQDWKRVRPADWEIQTRLDGEVAVLGASEAKGSTKIGKPKAARAPRPTKQKAPMLPPTPPPSQPLSRSPTSSPEASHAFNDTSSLLTAPPSDTDIDDDLPDLVLPPPPIFGAPPSPVSPSKRQTAGSSTARSPLKKIKSLPVGDLHTPGRGNLFLSRSVNELPAAEVEAEEDVFGSPIKMARSTLKHSEPTPSPGLLKTRRTRSKTARLDKENVAVKAIM